MALGRLLQETIHIYQHGAYQVIAGNDSVLLAEALSLSRVFLLCFPKGLSN